MKQKIELFNIPQILGLLVFMIFHPFRATSIPPDTSCDIHFQNAVSFFEKRSEGARDWRAASVNIDEAIRLFSISIDCENHRQESAYYLLRALHFKAMYTDIPEKERKHYYNLGKTLGESIILEFPEDVGLKLWYMANAGKWIEYYGILRAAYDGLGPRVKKTCEDIVRLDSLYENGIGYRILGIMYYRAPYIPYILTWPDKQKGIELTRKSLDVNPNNIGNLLFMGRILYLDEQYQKAIEYFNKCLDQEPREEYLIMERFDQMKAREFINLSIQEMHE